MYRTDLWTLWDKVRVGRSERTASKYVYDQMWNRSPVQVGCMRPVLRAGALGWPRGMGWGGRWEGGSRWGTHVNPWLIHVNVWKKTLQYCKIIRLQLIQINENTFVCWRPKSLHFVYSQNASKLLFHSDPFGNWVSNQVVGLTWLVLFKERKSAQTAQRHYSVKVKPENASYPPKKANLPTLW